MKRPFFDLFSSFAAVVDVDVFGVIDLGVVVVVVDVDVDGFDALS